MTAKALEKVKEKTKKFSTWRNSRDNTDYLLYSRARNQAKSECRKAKKDCEKKIASNDPHQSVMSDDDSVSNSDSVSQTDNATTDHLNDVDPATTKLTDIVSAIHQLESNLTSIISNSYKVELEGHKEYLRLHY